MACLLVLLLVFVFHNYINCATLPVILTAKDSTTTEEIKSVEIITPIPNSELFSEEKENSTKMIPFPSEISPNLTQKSHLPTAIMPMEIIQVPTKEINKTAEPFRNRFGHRIPKFLGRLAFLAGLKLREELTDGMASLNISTKDALNPAGNNLPLTRFGPYFAAVYEPFPFLPPSYLYSNLFGSLPFYNLMNPQKLPLINNFPATENLQNLQQSILSPSDETDNQDINDNFHREFIPENRKENTTLEKRINENVNFQGSKKNPTIASNLKETSSYPIEEESEEDEDAEENEDEESDKSEESEEVEETEDSTEENEQSESESEKLNGQLFASITKPIRQKMKKILPTLRPTKRTRPFKLRKTTKKPGRKTTRKTTTTTTTMTPTTIPPSMDPTNAVNTTRPPFNNNTGGYPYHPSYYGGYPNIHEVYLTTSENPSSHDHYNYNDAPPHFNEDWSNNRIAHESSLYSRYHPIYEGQSSGDEGPGTIYDNHSFRGSPALDHGTPPEIISNGFRPSFP